MDGQNQGIWLVLLLSLVSHVPCFPGLQGTPPLWSPTPYTPQEGSLFFLDLPSPIRLSTSPLALCLLLPQSLH